MPSYVRCRIPPTRPDPTRPYPTRPDFVAGRVRSCQFLDSTTRTRPCQVHAGEEGHARPGWTTSRRGQDSPWKSQSEWQRTGINGESTSVVWPAVGSRTATERNRTGPDQTRPTDRLGLRQVRRLCPMVVDLSAQSRHVRTLSVGLAGSGRVADEVRGSV